MGEEEPGEVVIDETIAMVDTLTATELLLEAVVVTFPPSVVTVVDG